MDKRWKVDKKVDKKVEKLDKKVVKVDRKWIKVDKKVDKVDRDFALIWLGFRVDLAGICRPFGGDP